MALYKCFSCAKYDPLRLGLYCAACFQKRHPWFRVEHRWVTIDRLEDVEAELARQAQRAEIDRNLDGVERLIADVRRTNETCDVIGVDPTGDDLVKASVRKLTEVDAHVSRLQRELAQAQRARELLARGGAAFGEADQLALVDYPHTRENCATHAFKAGNYESHCDNCYCESAAARTAVREK